MKRIKPKVLLSVVLSVLICTAIFAGCGGTAPASSTPAAQTSSTSTAAPADNAAAPAPTGEVPTLTFWGIGATPDDLQEGLGVINEYLAANIGVNIDIKMAGWGDWDTKVNTIVNSGEAFDVMFTNNTKYNQFVNMGAFEDITSSLQSVTPDLWNFIPEQVWNGTKIKGKIYAVPTYKDSSVTQYWNLDDVYVQKYSIDWASVKTMQDLDPIFRTIKEGEGKSFYPLNMSQGSIFSGFFNDYDGLTAGLQPLGVRFDDSSRKVVSVLEQPEIVENLRLLHEWYKAGIVNPDAPTLIEPNKGLPFTSAQGFPGAEIQWQILNGVDKYVSTPVFGPLYTTDTVQGSMTAISSNSKYKDEALKYIEFINIDHKMRDMLAFGIEGKHFEYVSENVVRKLTDTWTMPAYSQATFFTLSTIEGAPVDQWEQVKKLNEQATSSGCLGFALDFTDISTEISNCKATWDKYKFEMLTGASNPDVKIAECLAELRANGFDTIIAEAQKQIDEFYK